MVRFTGIPRTTLLMIVFAAFLLAGCAPSVVGKWEGDTVGENPLGVSMEFKPDGKFEKRLTTSGATITATGTYMTEGDKVDIKTEETKMGNVSGRLNNTQTAVFKVEGDKLTLDYGKGKAILTRAKP